MIYRALKYPLTLARKTYNDWKTYQYVTDRVKGVSKQGSFEFHLFKKEVISFLNSMRTDDTGIRYRYSSTCTQPTLYASAYACNTYSLLKELDVLDEGTKNSWIAYFDSFQNEKDGLFYDPTVHNEHYDDSDWWGARHQALHMISAYTQLGSRPRYPFRFLETYYDLNSLNNWLLKNEGAFLGEMNNDFDNKLMNISSLLQYQRDFWGDQNAGAAVKFLQEFLLKKINPETGIWGDSDLGNAVVRSRKVQFAYHLFPLFFYDNIYNFDLGKIAEVTLQTQNKFGGFGVAVNSSACDDIDSVDILIRISKFTEGYESEIKKALQTGMKWILLNQMQDGGFVFRLHESFIYGHNELSSQKNSGAVFPTWFRTLSLAYLCEFLGVSSDFKLVKCPGYEF